MIEWNRVSLLNDMTDDGKFVQITTIVHSNTFAIDVVKNAIDRIITIGEPFEDSVSDPLSKFPIDQRFTKARLESFHPIRLGIDLKTDVTETSHGYYPDECVLLCTKSPGPYSIVTITVWSGLMHDIRSAKKILDIFKIIITSFDCLLAISSEVIGTPILDEIDRFITIFKQPGYLLNDIMYWGRKLLTEPSSELLLGAPVYKTEKIRDGILLIMKPFFDEAALDDVRIWEYFGYYNLSIHVSDDELSLSYNYHEQTAPNEVQLLYIIQKDVGRIRNENPKSIVRFIIYDSRNNKTNSKVIRQLTTFLKSEKFPFAIHVAGGEYD